MAHVVMDRTSPRRAGSLRTGFWVLAILAAGSAGAVATAATAWVTRPTGTVQRLAALPAPADMDGAYNAFDAFRDQPPAAGAASTAAMSPARQNRL